MGMVRVLFSALLFLGGTGFAGRAGARESIFTRESLYYRVSIKGISTVDRFKGGGEKLPTREHPVYCIRTELRSYPAISLSLPLPEEGLLPWIKKGIFPRYSLRAVKEQDKGEKRGNLLLPGEGRSDP